LVFCLAQTFQRFKHAHAHNGRHGYLNQLKDVRGSSSGAQHTRISCLLF
jgi:hypothetical protein